MKRILTIAALLFSIHNLQAQRSDVELNRDSVVGWKYISNPINPKAVYKPIKSQYGFTYSVWQQQASDQLINWIQQSYLPRGLVVTAIGKNDNRLDIEDNGPLHRYGGMFKGFYTSFKQGKIDLNCCDPTILLQAGFNDFPGVYLKGFNPGGKYFFAEQASFSAGDDEAQLSKEAVDKKIQPNVYAYRTYLDHFHNNGLPSNKIGIVVAKNGEWPFNPVLVKDAINYFNQQLAAYPDLLKYDYDHQIKEINAAIERLKPYYNEPTKISKRLLTDEKGHSALSPADFLNGKKINKTFPEYYILVSTTQQTIDQTKTDKPLWLYFNLTPDITTYEGSLANFDTKFGTWVQHMVYSLLNNLNFDYINKWLSQPDAMKNIAYTPVNAPAKSSGNNILPPVSISAIAAAKNKDPFTILYEDFDGFPNGQLSTERWHTGGIRSFVNATLTKVDGQEGKWITIPKRLTFYPSFKNPLPQNFTVSYDVYFGTGISNKREMLYFRLDAYDPKEKYMKDMDMGWPVQKGTDFGIAMSGETITRCEFDNENITEIHDKGGKVPAFKEKDVAHVTVSVNGTGVAILVNGKEVVRNDKALPTAKSFKRMGWYCGAQGIYLGNIYVKSSTAVPQINTNEPQFAGVVKPKEKNSIPEASTFESAPYVQQLLPKLDAMPSISYPAGFKSAAPAPAVSGNTPAPGLKMDYKFPQKSALLGSISNTPPAADAYKKLIGDISTSAADKLQKENTIKIDNYLKTKKVTTSAAINKLAVDAWAEGKPTAALYLFCKAVQADFTDLNTANNLASLLNAYGYAEKAIPVLQYINKQNSGNPMVLSNLATAYYNLGDFSTADGFAQQTIAKDSLNSIANKIAAYNHLNKAQKNNDKTETQKAIQNLRQSLKGQYSKEASDMLGKIESNHRKEEDYFNTNLKEFPMLRRLMMPAMPEDLHQVTDFNKQMELEKSAVSQASDKVFAAIKKIPEPNRQQAIAATAKNIAMANTLVKANMIVTENAGWYIKMKKDLEDIFIQDKKALTTGFNKKANAAVKPYNDRLNKLEGGEGRGDEEEEMERLKKARCEAYNKEAASYLSDLAKLTNQFAQQSEYVSRIYWRDYANWTPYAQMDDSYRPFLTAQRGYLVDVLKIMSQYNAVEPCIYQPGEPQKEDKKTAKPKPWEEEYCSNFKGSVAGGATKLSFNCNSMSISGGAGIVGELSMSYNEDGTFKELTIGAGPGVEAHWGKKDIAALSAGASAMGYVSIGAGPGGGVQLTDWGMTAGVGASTNVLNVGGEANIFSGKLSAQSGVTVEGVVSDALNLNKKMGLKE